jgi:hypothetical protein
MRPSADKAIEEEEEVRHMRLLLQQQGLTDPVLCIVD